MGNAEPRAPRRRFNRAQRRILFVLADGHCVQCGAVLDHGWHADHVAPWAGGGPTRLPNGAALCAPCNLAKGATR